MSTKDDLSPLELKRAGNHLRFALVRQDEILLELPRDYEQLLATQLQDVLAEAAPLTIEVDLEGRTALSSRELGSLIALQKVLHQRFGRVPLTNVSGSVRHLLAMTQIDRLFDLP